MKKNSIKILLLVLLVSFGLGSCSHMLTPDPDNQYNNTRFKNDAVWAWGMVLNAYQSGSYLTAYPYNEVITDDAVTNDQSGSYYSYARMVLGEWGPLYYNGNVWSSAYGCILQMNYFLANIANTTVWSWQDTIRNRMLRQRFTGDALGFRAYNYHRLLQQFGGKAPDGTMLGVPLVNTLLATTDKWQVPRATFEATIQQIYSDIGGAVKLQPYRFRDIPNAVLPADLAWNRMNGVSSNLNLFDGERATAIKARAALLAASPAFNDGVNYNLVHADSAVQIVGRMVRNNGGFANCMGVDPLYWDDDADVTNTDILWRTDYATNNTLEGQNYPPSLYGSGRVNPTQNFVDAFPTSTGYPISWPDTIVSGYRPSNPYTNRDPRLNMQVVYNGGKYRLYGSVGNNNTINTQADAPTLANGSNDGLNKQATYTTRTGYYLKKGLRAIASVTTGATATARHFYPMVRWTELLLIYAEAANEKYGPDVDPGYGFTARNVIAGIRKRGYQTFATSSSSTIVQAGIPAADPYLATITTAAQMRDMIRNERRIELSFEGARFWDLRRWDVPFSKLTEPAKGVSITGTVKLVYDYSGNGVGLVEPRAWGPQAYYGPIPFAETIKYPGFIQNAGW